LAPVRLTGNFGSEVLRGVSTFKPIGLSPALFSSDFRESVSASDTKLTDSRKHPVTFAAFREIPWNLFGSLAAGRSQIGFRTPYLDNEIVAIAYRAPASLWKSPLPALRLVKKKDPALSRIPSDRGHILGNRGPAYLLRRLFSEATFKLDYQYSEGLPSWLSPADPLFGPFSIAGIVGLHKYLPYRRWFRQELAAHITEKLSDARVRRMSYWNGDVLDRLASDHIRGRKNYLREINAVLTLEAVERLFFRDLPDEASDLKDSTSKGLQKEPLLTR
jgi:asparagine synthase (glutamine-hydrolysing)